MNLRQFTGKQIPIYPSVDCLFPTVQMTSLSLEVNFGGDQQAKPFKYDIGQCVGLDLD
jgi:hypothetical protein